MKNTNLFFQNSNIRAEYSNNVQVILNGSIIRVQHGMAYVDFKASEWDAEDMDGLACILENYENGMGTWSEVVGYDQSPLANLVSDFNKDGFYNEDANFEDMLNHIKQYGFKIAYVGSLESFKGNKSDTVEINDTLLTVGMVESLIKETLKRLEVKTNKDIVNRIVDDIKINGLNEQTIMDAIE